MITERNTIITEQCAAKTINVGITVQLQLLWILFIVAGASSIAVIAALWEGLYFANEGVVVFALVVSALLFIAGLALLVKSVIRQRAGKKSGNIEVSGEFFYDCVIVREFKGKEIYNIIVIEYENILKVDEIGNHYYIYIKPGTVNSVYFDNYITVNDHRPLGAFVVVMAGLSDGERNTINSLLHLPYNKHIEILQPAVYKS